MNYQKLLNKLNQNNYPYQIWGNHSLNNDLFHARFLSAHQKQFDPHTLYLSSTSHLPDADIGGTFILFCYGTSADFSIYSGSSFNITYFGDSLNPEDLFNLIIESLTEIQQISTGMHILANALFSDKGLQYLVDTATSLFGNPIYVVDLQHKYLAMSAGIIPKNTLFKEESDRGYIGETGIQFIKASQINKKVRESNNAYYCINTLINQGMLIDAIHIQGIEVGHIMMLESEHPFRDFDPDFFHRFGKLVSVELQKSSLYSHNKGITYSYLLADLIKNPQKASKDMRKRLHAMGYHLKETFYIIAIPPAAHSTSDLRLHVITEQMKGILPESIYVNYEDTLVFLISRKIDQNLSEYEISRLESFLNANHLRAGISNFYQSLEETPRFYQQAVDSVHLGLKLGDPSPIFYYSDYYLYKMLETCEQADSEIRYLIHPGIMKLHLYDQEHDTDFIKTLIEYLRQPGQPGKIAEALHIHKNTLLYRMGKIKEITECTLTKGEDFMNFNLSIRIMYYLHML